MTRLWTCSPVATRTGAIASRMRRWPRMSSGLVGSSIHQDRPPTAPPIARNRLGDAPRLVRVERELVGGADRLAHDARTAQIGLGVTADLQLEMREPGFERLARAAARLSSVPSQPAEVVYAGNPSARSRCSRSPLVASFRRRIASAGLGVTSSM